MAKSASSGELGPDWLETIETGMEPLEDRAYIYQLDLPFDPESQLRAIHGLLVRNRTADDQLVAEIHSAEEHARKLNGIWNDYAVDISVDLMHDSAYQDAAHSMSALGMLAPFIEMVFSQCFAEIGRKFFATGAPPSRHDRWKSSAPETWDCHYRYSGGSLRKSSIIEGAKQLADELAMQKHLPADAWPSFTALFAYRNKMFHNGMEWPARERQRFERRITADGWKATWFSQATVNSQPWMFYMTPEFVDCCYDMANKLLDAFGRLIKTDLLSRRSQ